MKKLEKPQITFVIFTYNEEKRIEYPIKCFQDFGEVLIVDNYSQVATSQVDLTMDCYVLRRK